MPELGTGLAIGGSLLGGMLSGDASKDAASTAADAQIAAARLGVQEQKRQFDAIQKLLSPYASAGAASAVTPTQAIIDIYQRNIGRNPTASELQHQITNYKDKGVDFATIEKWVGSTTTAQRAALAGKTPKIKGALDAQKDLLGLNGTQAQQAAISGIQKSPYFSGLVQQGENAILQNAAATGGLRGGNVQAALAEFRPQMLAQLIESQFSKLGGLTSLGQNAAAGVGNAGMNSANSIAALMQQQGAAQAGSALAQGAATANQWAGVGGALGQLGGWITNRGGISGAGSSSGEFLGNGISGSIF